MTDRESVQLERAYLLHQRPYRNTSQIIDCLTDTHGLIALVAQGSRRPKSGNRAILQPFLSLRISWTRRGELGRLTHVELEPPATELTGTNLLAGFYLNELLLRLLAKGDTNVGVFSCYSLALSDLLARVDTSLALRRFELRLLDSLGYGLNLDHDVETEEPISPEQRYRFEPETGARSVNNAAQGAEYYWGRELIALREQTLSDADSLRAAKRLLSRTLRIYLGDRPLKTRAVLRAILDSGVEL